MAQCRSNTARRTWLRIIQLGARTTVYLNGKLVVDHAIMENYWGRKRPLVRKGPIQLQTHGGEIRWRNLFVREISPDEANGMLAAKHHDGFNSIFNGKDFSGWDGPIDNYQVADGMLMCKKGKKSLKEIYLFAWYLPDLHTIFIQNCCNIFDCCTFFSFLI